MAYTAREWSCGDKITADALNHMEQGIADASEKDYECSRVYTQILQESVTTQSAPGGYSGTFTYAKLITDDKVRVTFDGVEYECVRQNNPSPNPNVKESYYYGDPRDLTAYPFAIISTLQKSGGKYVVINRLITDEAKTYSVKMEAIEDVAETTDCFDIARGYSCDEEINLIMQESVTAEPTPGGWSEGDIDYSGVIQNETIIVTFDGVEYMCSRGIKTSGTKKTYYYGGIDFSGSDDYPDFSEYPFGIISDPNSGLDGNFLLVENEGTYSIKIESYARTVNTSSCFDAAVKDAVNASGKCITLRQLKRFENDNIGFTPSSSKVAEFQNPEAVSVAQGQYGTVRLTTTRMSTNNLIGCSISEIYTTANDGHLPPITSIKIDTSGEYAVYELEVYARDAALTIPAYSFTIKALGSYQPGYINDVCVLEGTCCEQEDPLG